MNLESLPLDGRIGGGPESWHLSAMCIPATVENDAIKLPPGRSMMPADEGAPYERTQGFIGGVKDRSESIPAKQEGVTQ